MVGAGFCFSFFVFFLVVLLGSLTVGTTTAPREPEEDGIGVPERAASLYVSCTRGGIDDKSTKLVPGRCVTIAAFVFFITTCHAQVASDGNC